MTRRIQHGKPFCLFALLMTLIISPAALAQTTAFTYQGKLTDAGNPANGNYDLQFKLFDTLTVGTGLQQGATVTVSNVLVTAGVFTVQLDFGAAVFPGAARFLEIAVRSISGGGFTMLSPRQPITSTPYAIRSANTATADGLSAACTGCVTSNQIQSLPPGSAGYIQNTINLQAASNFNISGNGFIGGKVGIGTTAADHALQVNGTTSLGAPGGVYGFSINSASPGPYPSLGFNAFYNAANFTYLAGVAGYGGIFQFQDGDGTFGYYNTGGSVAAGAAHAFAPRLLILKGGNVLIGEPALQTGAAFEVMGGAVALSALANDSPSIGVLAKGHTGVFGITDGNAGSLAGNFSGDVHVSGVLSHSAGSFKIDHPLDPANKYLSHAFVESPDMKNIYDGNVTTGASGEAEVMLPDWFEALNKDFRYQLTVIGQFAQAIVATKIKDNRFKIKTSLPNVEVSWQVTGIRQDAYAEQHRIPVEELKTKEEQGSYLHPEVFGQPEEQGVQWRLHPEIMRQQKEARERRQREQNNHAAARAARPANR